MTNNKNIDELLQAAKLSDDPTVKRALDKLLFVTSIAHDKEYIKNANEYHYHSGCTITVPRTEDMVTFQLVWNDEEIMVHSMPFCNQTFRYGTLIDANSPMPGAYLIEDKLYK